MPSPLVGNSLTSISSIMNLPPSPRPCARSDGASRPGVRAAAPLQLMPQPRQREAEASVCADSLSGSVPSPRPSPRPKAAQSAPTQHRPRMPRSPSGIMISSPLNPASHRQAAPIRHRTDQAQAYNLSVPRPRPVLTRLFSSSLNNLPVPNGHPCPPVMSESQLPTAVRPPLRREDFTSDESILTRVDSEVHHSKPVRITPPHSREPSCESDEEGYRGAPSSYSTFIESLMSPK